MLYDLQFTADGWEYFRVWIANVALTLVTLGVYSAWAKVRTRRYLYGNTWLGDASFDFTADPVSLLPGRFLAAALLAGLWFTDLVSPLHYGLPVYYYAALVAFAPLLPWVVIRARSFNLRHTRWRRVGLAFDGGYRGAALWYPVAIGVGIATLGIAWPWLRWRRDRYLIGNSRFGLTPFSFEGESAPYYRAYGGAGAVAVGGFILAIPFVSMVVAAGGGAIAASIVTLLPFFLASVYVRVRLANYRWCNTRLGLNRFRLELEPTRMMWLYISNMALIAATAGLFVPFARLRVLRYRLSRFTMYLVDDPAGFHADPAAAPAATGAEVGEAFEIDIGA